MVEIIKTTFKDHLADAPAKPIKSLPSPAALRNKILIKVKYVDPHKAASKVPTAAVAQSRPTLTHTSSATSGHSSTSSNADEGPVQTSDQGKKKKKASAIIPALSDLGIYTRSYHFSSLSSPNALIPEHVFSLSEKKLMELHQSTGPTLFSHNRNYLMRAFPSGLRVRSDNLDPSVFWRKGVQMVALNWQRWDEGMMLNEGMFTGSGGWVLKPTGYLGHRDRDDDDDDDKNGKDNNTTTAGGIKSKEEEKGAKAAAATGRLGEKIADESQASAITHKTLTLIITIFAAQDLPLPLGETTSTALHPYVKVELHVENPAERSGAPIEGGGHSRDEGQYKHQTRTGQGTDVDFRGEVVRFRDVPGVVEALSFVRYVLRTKLRLPPVLCYCPFGFLFCISASYIFCRHSLSGHCSALFHFYSISFIVYRQRCVCVCVFVYRYVDRFGQCTLNAQQASRRGWSRILLRNGAKRMRLSENVCWGVHA